MTTRLKSAGNRLGQATTEILLLLPLFVVLAGGAISIAYMCWQGIKVQEAANLAARIQGQERIVGGVSMGSIQMDNGTGMGMGDRAVSDSASAEDLLGGGGSAPPASSVYGKVYSAAKGFFSPEERKKMRVPPPVSGVNIDKVEVIRVLTPPKFMSMELPPIMLRGTAYGGEDPHMHGLPRWGNTGNGKQYYKSQIKKGTGND